MFKILILFYSKLEPLMWKTDDSPIKCLDHVGYLLYENVNTVFKQTVRIQDTSTYMEKERTQRVKHISLDIAQTSFKVTTNQTKKSN